MSRIDLIAQILLDAVARLPLDDGEERAEADTDHVAEERDADPS